MQKVRRSHSEDRGSRDDDGRSLSASDATALRQGTDRQLRPRSAGVRLVQTRSGWRPTPLKDFRSSRDIRIQAAEADAARRMWAQRLQAIDDRQLRESSSRRSPSAAHRRQQGRPVSVADFAKRPGKAAQSRAIKQQLRRHNALRPPGTVTPAFVDQPADASPSADELPTVQKGDEVTVEIQPGVARTGRVRACYEPRASAISSDKAQPGSTEVLVRFDVGGGWFEREQVQFKSRPEQPLEPNLLQRMMRDDPQLQAQLASLQQQNNGRESSGKISDLIRGNSRPQQQQQRRPARDGESIVSERTKEMFRLLMAENVDELQRLLDEGGDITKRNALGQTMYEVASFHKKWKSVSWLDSVAAAAQRYIEDNGDTLSAPMRAKVGEVIAVASPQVRVAAKAAIAAGRLGRGLRARKAAAGDGADT
jgi:hypothetical protein